MARDGPVLMASFRFHAARHGPASRSRAPWLSFGLHRSSASWARRRRRNVGAASRRHRRRPRRRRPDGRRGNLLSLSRCTQVGSGGWNDL
uniref:Uncharacterized protein n=1 Tax=Oryza punctata TaxID=4537 RepID=A0A0E0KQJ2_ORYPU